ncbi:Protein Eva-1 A [Manis pentadactyla]|nr:Protein Eva-1 A [Manis pentadactyla]
MEQRRVGVLRSLPLLPLLHPQELSLSDPGKRRAIGPAAASPGASSGCHVEAALTPQLGAGDPRSLDMALLSNILATYSFVSENPERAALYFVCGVCVGLVLTLAALVMRISCHTDCQRHPRKKVLQEPESSSDSSDSEDGSLDTASDLSVRRHRRFERTLNKNVFTSAEELQRAQRLEERERIIREIWMNIHAEGPCARSLNRYY